MSEKDPEFHLPPPPKKPPPLPPPPVAGQTSKDVYDEGPPPPNEGQMTYKKLNGSYGLIKLTGWKLAISTIIFGPIFGIILLYLNLTGHFMARAKHVPSYATRNSDIANSNTLTIASLFLVVWIIVGLIGSYKTVRNAIKGVQPDEANKTNSVDRDT